MTLIIVESPTKARTFNRIFKQKGQDDIYEVFATMGHFRDLPVKSMAIDFEHDFKPEYETTEGKQKVIDKLLELRKKHDEIIFATDPDREGEAISYHAAYIMGYITEDWPDFKFSLGEGIKRIVFHEITQKALEEALEHPEELRVNLVKAQQARRVLDRIVGYQVSPLLWKRTNKNWLSAGRVQTVALRLVVERGKEILAFSNSPYYTCSGSFKQNDTIIQANLISKDSIPYEQKTVLKLFAGEYTFTKTTIDDNNFESIKNDLEKDTYAISSVEENLTERFSPPPFTTSLLQQTAFQRFGFPSKLTMSLAQRLYEKGLITYHRTDSFNLSAKFVFPVKDYIISEFGKEYALEKPRGFSAKSKLAQEAHEAIRPTRLSYKDDEKAKEKLDKLNANEKKLYQLIFDRAVATQMAPAKIKKVSYNISGEKKYEFIAELEQVVFDGFLRLLQPTYAEKHKDLLAFEKDQPLILETATMERKETKAPPNYNEATLIKSLEEHGIGRPSTYASIISLIVEKDYISREGRIFMPTKLGNGICDYLSNSFKDIFTLDFTSNMEDRLDNIAEGKEKLLDVLNDFYGPFKKELEARSEDTEIIETDEVIEEPCPLCNSKLVIKRSRFGKFIACSGYPTCRFTRSIPKFVKDSKCGKCGARMVVRKSKTGGKTFFGCEKWPDCDWVVWTLKQAKDPSLVPPKNENAVKRVRKVKTEEETKVKKARKTTKKKAVVKKTVGKITAKKTVAKKKVVKKAIGKSVKKKEEE